jgi:hypothetical protein
MRFPGRTKVIFHAEMNLPVAAGKPALTPFGQLRGLCHFLHPQQIAKETPRGLLPTRRHRELDVIDIDEWSVRQGSMIAADWQPRKRGGSTSSSLG